MGAPAFGLEGTKETRIGIHDTCIQLYVHVYYGLICLTYVDSTEMIFMSSDLVMVNVEWGTETSIMEEADSMRRHSPTNPITDGSTSSTSR